MSTDMLAPDHPVGSRAMKPRQIREAAERLFMEHGYGAVSMDAIAREAGVSKATIYAHFPDKAQLFAAMMRSECEKQFPAVVSLDAEPTDLRATLVAVGRAYAGFLVSPGGLRVFRMVIAEAPRFPEFAEVFYENGPKAMPERLAVFLDRACAEGLLEIPDTRLSARQFLALLRSEFHLRAVLGIGAPVGEAEITANAEAAADMFLRAYGRRPAPPARRRAHGAR